jgi:ketosteroid isomerase-like protein
MKQRTTLKLPVCLFGMLFCSIAGFAQPPAGDGLKNEKNAVEKMNEQFFTAIQHNDFDSFSSQYSLDCWIMNPGTSVYCGPDAAQDFFADLVKKRKVTKGKFITTDLYGTEKGMLTEIGFYQLYGSANEQLDNGSYMVLWKRTDTGWQRFRESRNSNGSQNINSIR